MSHPRAGRTGLALASSAVLVTAVGVGSAGATPVVFSPATSSHAAAAPAEPPPPSTPVLVTAPEGTVTSYVVNVATANRKQTNRAEREIVAAGGVVVQSWPTIGVVVAHSTTADFLTRLDAKRSRPIESAGPTRTAPVKEATPLGSSPYGAGPERALTRTGLERRAPSRGDVAGRAVAADPREPEQWDMRMIKADQAQRIDDGRRKVTVAVVDSGIQPDHPDLEANIDTARSVDCTSAGRPDTTPLAWRSTTSSHGTHVAGTIAAARNGVGIVGVAPGVRVASVKVVNDDGFIYPEYAVCGIMWTAAKNIPVANHSYFVDPFEFWCDDQPEQAPAKEAVRRAFAWAHREGVVSAAAAGNSAYDLANKTTDANSPNDSTPVERRINNTCHDIPTELPGVVTVSAADESGDLASFSNRGAGVIDVVAPGVRVLSTVADGRYASYSGTSMASPHVAGVLALLTSTHPYASPRRLLDLLRAQADDKACPTTATTCVGTSEVNSYYGDGMVDALDAVRRR